MSEITGKNRCAKRIQISALSICNSSVFLALQFSVPPDMPPPVACWERADVGTANNAFILQRLIDRIAQIQALQYRHEFDVNNFACCRSRILWVAHSPSGL